MSEQRNQRRNGDERSVQRRGNEDWQRQQEQTRGDEHFRGQERFTGAYGRRDVDRRGSEEFRGRGYGSQDERGGGEYGDPLGRRREEDFRDYGRGQPGGAYEHAGERDYRHGGGYGGYGQQPGEAGGGFGSGRSYASEPGWGPGYGDQGRGNSSHPAQGGFPGSYGAQRGGYGGQDSGGRGYDYEPYGRRERDRYRGGTHDQGGYQSSQSRHAFSAGPQDQRFGESGHTYGEQGFAQSRYGYGREFERQRRQARGPKGYQRSDERLKEDICERLMNADHIDASEISVDVISGKVTLEGTVPQRRMKHAIEDLVDDCIGVKDIENKVRVATGEESRSETKTSIGSSEGSSGRA